MTGSSVGADPSEPGVASAHTSRRTPSAQDNLIAYGSRLGDGPITTTAGDLSRFLLALLRDKRLVKPASLQRMLAPSRREASYGLGIEISDTEIERILSKLGFGVVRANGEFTATIPTWRLDVGR